ncbi:MAG: SPFH domain-containing protein [Flavobacteriaceae bacterium]|nr:SPFH domain-containing protein [Flavobacteriaceae bacterium]
MSIPYDYIFLALGLLILFSSFVTVPQGTIAVITIFGKYRRLLSPGLSMKIPIIEQIFSRISIQNRSIELGFQAITADQANVNFSAMLLYAVINNEEESIKNVAFKFVDHRSFQSALIRTVEGSVRAFVATKKQSEILALRREIVEEVKDNLDVTLESWGYHLIDMQMNDITFDEEIVKSMARVVASNNLKAAAENEGQALLITKTKAAEADGNAIKISAEADRQAAILRGQAVASFREEVAKGMSLAAKEMQNSNLDTSVIMFTMWTEAIKNLAEHGKGNVIFMDGSVDGLQKTLKELMALNMMDFNAKHVK